MLPSSSDRSGVSAPFRWHSNYNQMMFAINCIIMSNVECETLTVCVFVLIQGFIFPVRHLFFDSYWCCDYYCYFCCFNTSWFKLTMSSIQFWIAAHSHTQMACGYTPNTYTYCKQIKCRNGAERITKFVSSFANILWFFFSVSVFLPLSVCFATNFFVFLCHQTWLLLLLLLMLMLMLLHIIMYENFSQKIYSNHTMAGNMKTCRKVGSRMLLLLMS